LKIFFTGASSFSGFWFAKTLAEAGHEVTATFTRESVEAYPDVGFAKARVEMLQGLIQPVWQASMGNEAFLQAFEHGEWDAICLHGSYVSDHKAADFPVLKAVESNTTGIQRITNYLATHGAPPVIWTGTYFEAGEGQGTEPLRNFSPYALSKQLSWEFVRFYCEQVGLPIGKFVMPNPFGPWEGKGFTSYLAKSWLAGEVPIVQTPDYVRDNIPVGLLAKAYLDYIESKTYAEYQKPSGYRESVAQFTSRFAEYMSCNSSYSTDYVSSEQRSFEKPLVRYNKSSALKIFSQYDEQSFWVNYIEWIENHLGTETEEKN
jgi:UDP-glucose 4-epimerase